MGCDIHAIIESRVISPLTHPALIPGWDIEAEPRIDRYYDLFSVMAGVRPQPEYPCLIEPRGFPADLDFSSRSRFAEWNAKYPLHTISWLTTAELITVSTKVESYQIEALTTYMAAFARFEREARIIFGFDN